MPSIGAVVDPGWQMSAEESGPRGPDATKSDGLLLQGTYRDLWAADVVYNPALRFLMPKQKLELAAKDAEGLGHHRTG